MLLESSDFDKRIGITGVGTLNATGLTVETSWRNWLQGNSGISLVRVGNRRFHTEELLGNIKGFNFYHQYSDKQKERNPLVARYALHAAVQAVDDAGLLEVLNPPSKFKDPVYKLQGVDPERVGVILGQAMGDPDSAARVREALLLKRDFREVDMWTIMHLDNNQAAAIVARYLNAEGGTFAVAAACASGAVAIDIACDRILAGKNDIVLAGGAEGSKIEAGVLGFQRWEALSPYKDDPQHASRPLDASAKGFVIGEGAGVVVVERLSHAIARGVRIYAEVLSTRYISAASEPIQPKVKSEARVMKLVVSDLDRIGVPVTKIGYLNPHAAGTPAGDGVELKATEEALGEHAKRMPISSTKRFIGHCMGAAGGIESIAVMKTLQTGIIHPNPLYQGPVEEGFNIPQKPIYANPLVAFKNSFGLNGTYFSGAFGKYPDWERAIAG